MRKIRSQESKMGVVEMRMLRWMISVIRRDMIRSKFVSESVNRKIQEMHKDSVCQI